MVKYFSILLTLFFTIDAYGVTYGAFRNNVQGGARSIGLGGAFVAVQEGAGSLWISPAMIPIAEPGVDGTLTNGFAFSQERLPGVFSETIVKTAYQLFGFSYTFKNIPSVAVGFGMPFSEGVDDPLFAQSQLAIYETRISVGHAFFEKLSLSPLLIFRTATEKYGNNTDSGGQTVSTEQSATGTDVGFSAAYFITPLLIGAVSWEPPRTFGLTNPSGVTPQGNGISNVKIPAFTRFGFTYKIPDLKLLFSSQLDWIAGTGGLSSYIDAQNIGAQAVTTGDNIIIPRFGVEHQFVDKFWARSWLRMGWYKEQPRIIQQVARDHWTIGMEVRIWVLFLNFGYDYAPGFANAGTSMGLNITEYL